MATQHGMRSCANVVGETSQSPTSTSNLDPMVHMEKLKAVVKDTVTVDPELVCIQPCFVNS